MIDMVGTVGTVGMVGMVGMVGKCGKCGKCGKFWIETVETVETVQTVETVETVERLNVLYMCLLPTFGLKWLVIDQCIYKLLASWHWCVASAAVWAAILGKTSFEMRLFAVAKHHPRQHPVAIVCHVRIVHQIHMHAIMVKNDLPVVVVDHNNAVHCHHDAGMLGC